MKAHTKRFAVLALVAAVTIGGVGIGRAVGVGAGDGSGRAGRRAQWAALGLTDAQKAQIKAIMQKYRPTLEPQIKQLVAARRTLRAMINAPTADEGAIRSQAAQVAAVQADLAVQRARIAHEIRPLLTPEQAAKLQELRADREARVDGWFDRVATRLEAN